MWPAGLAPPEIGQRVSTTLLSTFPTLNKFTALPMRGLRAAGQIGRLLEIQPASPTPPAVSLQPLSRYKPPQQGFRRAGGVPLPRGL